MDWITNIRDWLGGYPYEFATVEEVFKFMKINFPDFKLANIKTTNTVDANWFLFKRI
jgi:2-polyprenyl-6-hydroxyphenyl methylase/3-demethylubiquinone-9 3-methyltransferase